MANTDDLPEPEPAPPPLGAGIDLADPNGPLAPYYASNAGMVLSLLLTLAGVLYAYQPLWNTDIWGHVAYGRWMAEHGIPAHEPLNPFTDKEQTFGPFSWLAQRGYYALVSVGQRLHPTHELHALQAGAELIRFVHWLAQVGTFVFLWLACRRQSGSTIASNVALGILLVSLPTMLGIQRPQAFGVFFFSIVMWLWSGSGRSWKANVFVVLLFLVWANIHGSFAIALVLMGVHWVGTTLPMLRRDGWRATAKNRTVQSTFAVVTACFLVTFVNPRGPLLYVDMMNLGKHPNIQSITEWRMLEMEQTGAWIVSIGSVLFVVACMLIARRFVLVEVLMLLVFAAWGFYQQRMLVWWFVLFPWVAVPSFRAVYAGFGFTLPTQPPELNFRKTFVAVGLGIVGFLFTPWIDLAQTRLIRPPQQAFADGTCWPLAMELNAPTERRGTYIPALDAALRRAYPEGRYTGTIFATETQADILLFTQPADRPVSMFSHAHAFPADYWTRCRGVKAGDPTWKDDLRAWKVNLIVAEPMFNIGLTRRLRNDPEWEIVFDEEGDEKVQDERGRKVIALRKSPILK